MIRGGAQSIVNYRTRELRGGPESYTSMDVYTYTYLINIAFEGAMTRYLYVGLTPNPKPAMWSVKYIAGTIR